MRFVLDQDVDARVCKILTSAGHDAWTADLAGLSEAADDDLTLYVNKKNAVLVTHDQEFSRRRRKNPIGRHVHLDCPDTSAREIVEAHLPEILDALDGMEHVYVRATVTQVTRTTRWT